MKIAEGRHLYSEGRPSCWASAHILVCLCMKYLGNLWTDLHQIHMEDVFGPSLGRVWMWRSKVKVTQVKKWHFLALLLACVQFMFGKTSSASSFYSDWFLENTNLNLVMNCTSIVKLLRACNLMLYARKVKQFVMFCISLKTCVRALTKIVC